MNAAAPAISALPWDERRGLHAMLWFIATEAMLFVSLFFSYFLLGSRQPHWPPDAPPSLKLAFIMLVVLTASSGVLEWGRHFSKQGREALARGAIVATVALGATFLFLQSLEFRERLKHVLPTTDAYGSMFYAITSVHGVHVALGVLMLAYVAMLPHVGPHASRPPHRPLHAVSLYWHFVDAAWIVIVVLLYVLPNLSGAGS